MGPGLAKVVWEYFHPPLDGDPESAPEGSNTAADAVDRENEPTLELAG